MTFLRKKTPSGREILIPFGGRRVRELKNKGWVIIIKK